MITVRRLAAASGGGRGPRAWLGQGPAPGPAGGQAAEPAGGQRSGRGRGQEAAIHTKEAQLND